MMGETEAEPVPPREGVCLEKIAIGVLFTSCCPLYPHPCSSVSGAEPNGDLAMPALADIYLTLAKCGHCSQVMGLY